ncbi:MAG: hypothetical protein C4319_08695 [Acidimicrobiia bacterium]
MGKVADAESVRRCAAEPTAEGGEPPANWANTARTGFAVCALGKRWKPACPIWVGQRVIHGQGSFDRAGDMGSRSGESGERTWGRRTSRASQDSEARRKANASRDVADSPSFAVSDDESVSQPSASGNGPGKTSAQTFSASRSKSSVRRRSTGKSAYSSSSSALRGRIPTTHTRGKGDSDQLIARYLREISRVPLLTADQEKALARRIEAGRIAEKRLSVMGEPEPQLENDLMRVIEDGLRAKRLMIEANLRLVVSVAKRYVKSGLPLLDLVQEGNIGLIRAVERFDYRLGYRFSTYATWWIKQAIRRALSDQSRTVRIPAHVTDEAARVRRTYDELRQRLGEEPNLEEVAKEAGISKDRIQELLSLMYSPLSLDAPVGEDEGASLSEILCGDMNEMPQELITKSLLREEMLWAMQDLTPRERQVLKMRFGLDGERPRTLEEVGRTISVTRERVRQIEARCLAKLRHPSRAKHLREYLQ